MAVQSIVKLTYRLHSPCVKARVKESVCWLEDRTGTTEFSVWSGTGDRSLAGRGGGEVRGTAVCKTGRVSSGQDANSWI